MGCTPHSSVTPTIQPPVHGWPFSWGQQCCHEPLQEAEAAPRAPGLPPRPETSLEAQTCPDPQDQDQNTHSGWCVCVYATRAGIRPWYASNCGPLPKPLTHAETGILPGK